MAKNIPPRQEFHKDLLVLAFPDFKSWMKWLGHHHEQPEGVWMKFAKKGSGIRSITYVEAREAAIIFGWIDGLINGYDDKYFLTKFTQRRRRSRWSKINRGIAEQLFREGKMMPSGLTQVEAAQADGRWAAAYDSQSTIEVPVELKKELDKNEKAKKFFDSLSNAHRYAFLYRIQNAKRPETRQRHIDKTMELLKSELTLHSLLKKKK